MTPTLTKELSRMHENAEQIQSDALASVGLGIGDNLRQGDLYVVRIDRLPAGKPRTDRQLAIGSTQGSRHVLEGDVIRLIDPDEQEAGETLGRHGAAEVRGYQIGPAFEISDPVTLAHPEHGDRQLTEPGCYQVVYQRALDAEEREMREAD